MLTVLWLDGSADAAGHMTRLLHTDREVAFTHLLTLGCSLSPETPPELH